MVKDIELMRGELAKTPYVRAFGYEMVEDKDVLGAMQIADREMYTNKAKLKEFNDTISDYSGEKNYDVEYRFKVKSGDREQRGSL